MDILHPHLLSKQQLLDIFRQRHISIPRLEESTRDELISLYSKYLLPLPRRGGSSSNPQDSSSLPQDVEMADASSKSTNSNGDSRRPSSNVRNRIVYSDSPVDNVSHGMKRIKLINTGGGGANVASSPKPVMVKRTLEISPGKSSSMGSAVSPAPSKRQKITWP
ncbi:AAEL007744-PA [Aedes aegypti]|uniref:AAEL007744-PA n=1 Tax=Aedes aegypti TaxID=7159 RepID=Q170Y5_AEDAE|nr:AAEL007744-PA [Aedes aegypti]